MATEKEFDPLRDYPLASRRPELLKTPSGRAFDEISMENLLADQIDAREVRIRAETLEMQARIAESHGRPSLAANFRRAKELTLVPDEEVLAIYNALRPRRSTKEELLRIADELESRYGAVHNARFVREAAEVYERRGLLKKGETDMGKGGGS
jgi:propanediol dehydratase small subunit